MAKDSKDSAPKGGDGKELTEEELAAQIQQEEIDKKIQEGIAKGLAEAAKTAPKVVAAAAVKAPVREQAVVPLEDHVCHVGGVKYTLEKQKVTKVPDHVAGALQNAGKVRFTNG